MNPNFWQMPQDSTELEKGMSYDTKLVRGMSYDTELVRGMTYEEEPKVVKVREENLQNGMRYLPEESAALAEEICESISLDKDANVFKNIFAPLLAEGLAQYGEQTSAKANGDTVTMEDINTYLYCKSESSPFLIGDIYTNPSSRAAGYMDLSVKFTNQTAKDLRNATIGFAAWDFNALPIKLQVLYDFVEDNDYVLEMNLENITSDFSDRVYYLQVEETDIGYINAVLLEYEDFEGNVWKNPLASYYKEMASLPVDDSTIAYEFGNITEE